jgi:hypothetical protein
MYDEVASKVLEQHDYESAASRTTYAGPVGCSSIISAIPPAQLPMNYSVCFTGPFGHQIIEEVASSPVGGVFDETPAVRSIGVWDEAFDARFNWIGDSKSKRFRTCPDGLLRKVHSVRYIGETCKASGKPNVVTLHHYCSSANDGGSNNHARLTSVKSALQYPEWSPFLTDDEKAIPCECQQEMFLSSPWICTKDPSFADHGLSRFDQLIRSMFNANFKRSGFTSERSSDDDFGKEVGEFMHRARLRIHTSVFANAQYVVSVSRNPCSHTR